MTLDTGIAETDRGKSTDTLSLMLADSYILYLKTHNFHRKVTGPVFQTSYAVFVTRLHEIAECTGPHCRTHTRPGFPGANTTCFLLTGG
jgi:starvation-inducible DNA-binding protein